MTRRGTTPTHTFKPKTKEGEPVDSGVILTAPNETKWTLQVANDGTVSATAVT